MNKGAFGESTDKNVLETGEGFASPELAEASGGFLDGRRSEELPNQGRREDHDVLAALDVELGLLGPVARQAQLLSFNVQRKQMWRKRCTVKYRCLNSFQTTHNTRPLAALFPLVNHKSKNALFRFETNFMC